MAPQLARLLTAAALSILALMLLLGTNPWAGPRLLPVVPHHGLHVGDVPVLLVWAGGLLGLRRLDR